VGPIEFISFLIFMGTVTGIVRMLVNAFTGGGGKRKALSAELKASRDQLRAMETQLLDARLQNDQLHKQLEWHTKMLETQDRLVKQLTDTSVRVPVVSAS
jgi:hypothetical protein